MDYFGLIPLTTNRVARYGDITGGSGINRIITVINTTTTAAAVAGKDYVYLCSGTITLTLPTAIGNTNLYTVKNTGTGIISIATTAAQTIDGGTAPITITRLNTSLSFISNNSNWFLI